MFDFQETILPLAPKLYRYCYRLTMNERDAEDLVQDTLLRAFDKFEQFQQGTSPLAWLFTIGRSIFINQYRKKQREGQSLSFEDMDRDIDRFEPPAHFPDNPEEFLFRNVLDTELRDALSALPLHYLEVLLLVDLEEISYKEASEILNIPSGTVMSRLHRARKTLQGSLLELAQRKGIVKTKVHPIKERNATSRGEAQNG
ncbi:MAG: sigma-70 family RNA polymerase sigma factor [Acidobacteria bacterium]|nr:sigma-70 family RNA polymerase sigma factor [Acidobacteriota bacterium]MCB9398178.1 sigma-70 family RNA polymerase sigma factor [Acidobacteriota bacterium]